MTTLPTSEDAPRAHAVTATRSWPVSELVVAMMTSVLLHIAWFTFFLATVGLHPEPPWVVFAADPGAVDEVIIGAPAPKAASVRTAPPPSPIPPSEPVTRVPEPTLTPPAETVGRIPEPTRETRAAPNDSPTVSAAPELEFPAVATPRPLTPSPATAAAPLLPPIPEP